MYMKYAVNTVCSMQYAICSMHDSKPQQNCFKIVWNQERGIYRCITLKACRGAHSLMFTCDKALSLTVGRSIRQNEHATT